MSLIAAAAASISTGRVSLDALIDISDTQLTPTTCTAGLRVDADGKLYSIATLSSAEVANWITPLTSAGVLYSVRVTVNSGSLTTGTSGSWLTLETDREWTVVQDGGTVGTQTANITVEIRRGSGAALDSATINLTAEVVT